MRALGLRLGAERFSPLRLLLLVLLGAFNTTSALETGMKADGDVMGGAMSEVVEQGASHPLHQDLDAIAVDLHDGREDRVG